MAAQRPKPKTQRRFLPLLCLLILALAAAGCSSDAAIGNGSITTGPRDFKHTASSISFAAQQPSPLIPPVLLAQGRQVRFRHLTPEMGLSQSVVQDMLQDRQGFMWFATQEGLDRYDGNTVKVFKHDAADSSSLSSNFLFAIDQDSSGGLWIGTNGGGLERYDTDTGRFSHHTSTPGDPTTLSENSVLSVFVDRAGLVWAGTTNSGLNVLDPATDHVTRYQNNANDPASLSGNSISSIVQDANGAVWIGTFGAGLNRLDPATGKFVRYLNDPGSSSSLASNLIQTLYVDRAGSLWVGTINAGADRFDSQTGAFVHYPARPDDPTALGHPWVYAFLQDRSGRMWMGTHGGGLYALDPDTGRFTRFVHSEDDPESLGLNNVWSMFEDRSGVLWFGTFGAGVDRYDPEKDKFLLLRPSRQGAPGLASGQVWGIYQDSSDRLWIGTNGGGLDRLDLKTGEWKNYRNDPSNPNSLRNDFVFNIYQDRSGVLWVSTNGGLSRFDPQTERFDSYGPPGTVMVTYEDRQGDFWVGTGAGLTLLDRNTGATQNYAHAESDPTSLSGSAVDAFAEDDSGNLWIASQNGGLNRFDRATGGFTHYLNNPHDPSSLSVNAILSIYPARDGTLWLGTGAGLDRFDPRTGRATAYHEKDGLPSDMVYAALQDSQGRLWLSTNRGISRFDPATGQFKNYAKSAGLQDYEFNQGAYFKNRDGLMFMGGLNGLNVFDPERIQDSAFTPPVVITDLQIYNKSVPVGPNSPLKAPIEQSRALTLSYQDSFFGFEFAALHYSTPEDNRYAYMLEGLDKDWNYTGNRHFASYTNVPPGDYVFKVKATNADGMWNEQGTSLNISIPPPFWQTTWFRLLVLAALLGGAAGLVTYRIRSIEAQRRRLEVQVNERTQELRQAMTDLERSKEAAEAASRAKSVFLANMSHEFRTPLNAVLGFTQVLTRDERLQGDQRENLEIIYRSSEHLLGLINDVLEMSKIEAGRTVLNERAFDLWRMLEGLGEMFELRAQGRGITLKQESDPAVPRYVRGDEGKLRQVLMNLLGNAVKFTLQGEVVLDVRPCDPPAGPRPSADAAPSAWISFSVCDTGPGIAPAEIEQLFTPFVQSLSGRQSQEGTGLGLAISRQYVQLMGGEIRVSSEVGKGSTFEFRIPVRAVTAADLDRPPTTRRVVGLEPGQPTCRMLVVDDQEINRKLLVKILAPLGVEVREAANGAEAVGVWEQWEPHLIWMDMRMPVMDGYEATRRIKATTRGQATVIVAITASGLEEEKGVILSEGCDDYMRKPFRDEELYAVAAKHLGLRYIYQELAAGQGPPKPVTPEAGEGTGQDQAMASRLSAIGTESLSRLEQEAMLGDWTALKKRAQEICGQDAVLAEYISALADRFDHDRILMLARQARALKQEREQVKTHG